MDERAKSAASAFWADADDAEALQQFRALVSAVDDGIYQLDSGGRFVAVNDAVVETTGYDRERLLGEHVSLLLDGEAVRTFEREIERRLRGAVGSAGSPGIAGSSGHTEASPDRTETFEFAVLTADGGRIPCELRFSLLVDESTFRGSVGVIREVPERERTERALDRHRERERDLERYETIVEAVNEGVYVVGEDGRFTMVNEAYAELTGYSREELVGEHVSLVADEDVRRRAERAEDRLDDGDATHPVIEAELETKSGERVPVEATFALLPSSADEHRVGVVRDLTERRRLETELDEVFGRVTDAFYALDDEWRITHANDRAEDLIDYSGEGLVGRNFWEVFEWAADSKLGEEYREAMSTQEPTSFEFYYPDPLEAWYEIRAYPSETGLSVYFRDVTERMEYERRLEESERRYRTLAEHFPNGAVSVYDHDLRYELAQGGKLGEDLPSRDRLEGNRMPEIFPADTVADLEPVFRAAVEDGETGSTTTEFGGRNWRLWATPLRDADGEIFAGLSFAQDITEQVERERKLEETVEKLEESNERLESFASMLAHELRNPVTIGQIYSQQLPDDADSEAVEYVTEAFDRIEDMIDVMLVLTRGGEAVGERTPLSISDVAREAWDGLDAPEATLEVDVDATLQADETYVRHLFRNLFENSVEHGSTSNRPSADDVAQHDGGGVTICVGELTDGFYVADDGEGIPPARRDDVFETGFTTAGDEGGTGLGLAFVRKLAEVYGWTCSVHESESGGARFEFRNVTLDAGE